MKTRMIFSTILLLMYAISACTNRVLVSSTPIVRNVITMDDHPSIQNCKSYSKSTLKGNGYVIIDNPSSNNDSHLINMNSMEEAAIFNTTTFFAISPDSSNLAFLRSGSDPSQMVVISKKKKADISTKGWSYITRWANNNTLILAKNLSPVSPLIFLNPFSGETKSFDPDVSLQNISNLLPYENWNGYTLVVFNPSLDYFVYPKMAKSGTELDVIDATNQKLINKVEPIFGRSIPEWSPSGLSLVVAKPIDINTQLNPVGSDLYEVSIKGEIKRLTNLSTLYPNLMINSYKWSPDGRFIAFWFTPDQTQNNPTVYFAVLEVITENLSISCLTSDVDITLVLPPVWSPDSSQIILSIIPGKNISGSLALFDLKKSSYFIFPNNNNMVPIGWLNFNPLPMLDLTH